MENCVEEKGALYMNEMLFSLFLENIFLKEFVNDLDSLNNVFYYENAGPSAIFPGRFIGFFSTFNSGLLSSIKQSRKPLPYLLSLLSH